MVKIRNANYCNLKLFLTFTVVYGHLIEPKIWHSDELMFQYRLVYMMHMPLFCFLSGLFLSNPKACKAQLFRMLPLYVLSQGIAVIFGNGEVEVLTPFWHLWYLLSYCTWLTLAWAWFCICKGKGGFLILLGSITLGCAVGFVPSVGRQFSLSRTLVFLPYFWSGLICKPSVEWKKFRCVGVVALLTAVLVAFFAAESMPVTFLYHDGSYSNLNNGAVLRLVCYLLGASFGLFLSDAEVSVYKAWGKYDGFVFASCSDCTVH